MASLLPFTQIALPSLELQPPGHATPILKQEYKGRNQDHLCKRTDRS